MFIRMLPFYEQAGALFNAFNCSACSACSDPATSRSPASASLRSGAPAIQVAQSIMEPGGDRPRISAEYTWRHEWVISNLPPGNWISETTSYRSVGWTVWRFRSNGMYRGTVPISHDRRRSLTVQATRCCSASARTPGFPPVDQFTTLQRSPAWNYVVTMLVYHQYASESRPAHGLRVRPAGLGRRLGDYAHAACTPAGLTPPLPTARSISSRTRSALGPTPYPAFTTALTVTGTLIF